MREDDLANAIIENPRPEDNTSAADAMIYPEAHYHHYGERGSVDLYIYVDNYVGAPTYGNLIEMKSKYAVQNVTGANAIIRQFNRMREFFFLDESWTTPNIVHYELSFLPSEYNIRHLYKNEAMYVSAISQDRNRTESPDDSFLSTCPVDPDEVKIKSKITLRSPIVGDPSPVDLITSNRNFLRNPEGCESFLKYVQDENKKFYQEHIDALNILEEKIN